MNNLSLLFTLFPREISKPSTWVTADALALLAVSGIRIYPSLPLIRLELDADQRQHRQLRLFLYVNLDDNDTLNPYPDPKTKEEYSGPPLTSTHRLLLRVRPLNSRQRDEAPASPPITRRAAANSAPVDSSSCRYLTPRRFGLFSGFSPGGLCCRLRAERGSGVAERGRFPRTGRPGSIQRDG